VPGNHRLAIYNLKHCLNLDCLSCYREVVTDLIEEYKAAEKLDYVTWGMTGHATNPRDDPRMGAVDNEDV
jgi:hypothetical protein